MDYQTAIRKIALDPEKEMSWGSRVEWYTFEDYFKLHIHGPWSVANHCLGLDFDVRRKSHTITIDGKEIRLSAESFKELKRQLGE